MGGAFCHALTVDQVRCRRHFDNIYSRPVGPYAHVGNTRLSNDATIPIIAGHQNCARHFVVILVDLDDAKIISPAAALAQSVRQQSSAPC